MKLEKSFQIRTVGTLQIAKLELRSQVLICTAFM